jgi:hypothetical protein
LNKVACGLHGNEKTEEVDTEDFVSGDGGDGDVLRTQAEARAISYLYRRLAARLKPCPSGSCPARNAEVAHA